MLLVDASRLGYARSVCEHPPESLKASLGIYVWGMLTDWRLWAIAFGCGLLAGVVSGVLGLGSGTLGAAVGAPTGVYCAFRLGRVRRCGRCGSIVRLPLSQPVPPPPNGGSGAARGPRSSSR